MSKASLHPMYLCSLFLQRDLSALINEKGRKKHPKAAPRHTFTVELTLNTTILHFYLCYFVFNMHLANFYLFLDIQKCFLNAWVFEKTIGSSAIILVG